MLACALAFLAGICLLSCLPRLPDATTLGAVSLLLLPAWYWRRRLTPFPLLLLGGFCWAGCHGLLVAGASLPPQLEGQTLDIRGTVQGLPERLGNNRLRLRFLLESWHRRDGWQPLALPLRLVWYRDAPPMRAGERWQLRVRLKKPHGRVNPAGFDYERWLFAEGIGATGYVRSAPSNRRLRVAGVWLWQSLRGRAAAALKRLPFDPGQLALLRALALGDRSAMSAEQWQLLQRTGTSHLLAISGLHIGLVAGLVFVLVQRGWRWLGAARWLAAPRAAALSALVAAFAYALLSGFQVPAQRAALMTALWMAALLTTGAAQPWRVLALALWAVLLLHPLAVLGAGFWLSFSAVAVLLFLSLGWHGRPPRWRQALRLQLALVAAITPLVWLWFGQAPLAAPLANLVAVPWVGLLLVPPLLLGVLLLPLAPALAQIPLQLAVWSLQGLWRFLETLAAAGGNLMWQMPAVGPATLGLLALAVVIATAAATTGQRALAILLILPLLTAPSPRPARGDFWLTLLDVGQGLALVIETRDHVLVYDAGPAFDGGFDSGRDIVVPVLRRRGHKRLDRLVISHSDKDHSGGGQAVAAAFGALEVDAGEPGKIDWARANDCRRQPAWEWDDVRFHYLPLAPVRGVDNAFSCVLKIVAADGRSALLPGDICVATEAALVDCCRAGLAADVLIAPHHGSKSSSGEPFVAAVAPALVLFSTGYRNRFGFPAAGVVRRYARAGARTLDTASSGAVRVRVEAGQALDVQGWRPAHPRIWRDPG